MKEKIYCFQCHNSVYLNTNYVRNSEMWGNRVCLYCYALKQTLPKDRLINGCRDLKLENREKYLNGDWKANSSACNYPG